MNNKTQVAYAEESLAPLQFKDHVNAFIVDSDGNGGTFRRIS